MLTLDTDSTTTVNAHRTGDEPRIAAARWAAIVDDEPLVRKMTARVLERIGFETTQHADGADFLEHLALSAEDPDVLVLDLVMPGIDGPELLRRLDSLGRPLPTVIVSGYADGRLPEELAGRIDAAYLAKPFGIADLATAVQRVARARR